MEKKKRPNPSQITNFFSKVPKKNVEISDESENIEKSGNFEKSEEKITQQSNVVTEQLDFSENVQEQGHYLKNEPFHPESDFNFPITVKNNGKKRKANHEWFKERPWLHYDVKTDSIFCFMCQKELKKQTVLIDRKVEPSFVSKGFKDWHNAFSSFKKHEKSGLHVQALGNQLENR